VYTYYDTTNIEMFSFLGSSPVRRRLQFFEVILS